MGGCGRRRWWKRIRTQDDVPSRPEAIRRLVEERLKMSASIPVPSKEVVQKASTLAAREIENLGDKSQPLEEQQRRKRRLIRGPREFRDIRGDQPRQEKMNGGASLLSRYVAGRHVWRD